MSMFSDLVANLTTLNILKVLKADNAPIPELPPPIVLIQRSIKLKMTKVPSKELKGSRT